MSTLAKAVLTQTGKELAGTVTKELKQRVLGDPEQRAMERALKRAYETTRASHGHTLAQYDVNPNFLEFEGAAELAKVLVPGARASADKLAQRCVDSLAPNLDEDTRWDRLVALRPAFKTLIESLEAEVRGERALDGIIGRVDDASAADAASRLVERFGAARATDQDEAEYLHWVIDRHRYLRTTGMVHNSIVQLPLLDVFVGLSAQRDARPGDRAEAWFKREQAKLQARLESRELDQLGYEAAVDRLELQFGYEAGRLGGRTDPQPLPVLDAVRTIRHLLVLGEPGSGKTTLLKYLALRHSQALRDPATADLPNPLFPIYLRIGDFARSPVRGQGIGAFLADYLQSQECRGSGLRDLLERKLAAGECLVLLDGLDEIASAEDRRTVVEAVTNFVTANSRQGNRFVVTSRIAGYLAAPLPAPFEAVRVRDMDDPTIERFLDLYCRAVERAEAPEKADAVVRHDAGLETSAMNEALRQNPGVRRLAANPLLLTALVLVHRASGRLPNRRVDAYVEVTEALGRTWRSVQGVPEADLPDERMLTGWLTRLGSWLHEHRPEGSANKRELLEVLGPLWAKHHGTEWEPTLLQAADPLDSEAGRGVQDFVSKADFHTGLLVERAPGRYGFPHLTFEEYYAGRALAFEGITVDRAAGIRRRLHDPRYEEPILLALGLVGRTQPEEVQRLVAEAVYPANKHRGEYEDLLGWDFLFALRLLADGIPLETATVDALLHQAIDEWFRDDESRCRFTRYRKALAGRLSGLGVTRAAERLLAAVSAEAPRLAGADPRRFCELVAVLPSGRALPDPVVSAVTDLLESADDPYVRVAAVRSLVSGGVLGPEVVGVLVGLVRGADDPWVRVAAVGALVSGGVLVPEVVAAAVELVRGADDPEVRVAAVGALGSGGVLGPEVVGVLLEVVRGADDPYVRVAAVGALVSGGVLGPEVVGVLLEVVRGADHPGVRVAAVRSLVSVGVLVPEVVAAAVEVVQGADDPYVRMAAVGALVSGGVLGPEVVGVLLEVVRGADHPYVRAEAVWALGSGGVLGPEVVGVLLEVVRGADDPGVRMAAVGALVSGGVLGPEVVGVLLEVVRGADDPGVRVAAAKALSEAGELPAEALPALVEIATSSDDWTVRRDAIRFLEQAEPNAQLRTMLLSLFGDSDYGVPKAAGRTLVALVRRHPDVELAVKAGLAEACRALEPEGVDEQERRAGWDDAYDALWTLTENLASKV